MGFQSSDALFWTWNPRFFVAVRLLKHFTKAILDHFPDPDPHLTAPLRLQIKRIQLCASSVRHSAPLLGTQQRSGGGSGGKDVRDHAAVFGIFVFVVGHRRHDEGQPRDPVGHSGARLAQSERHVPRGGGIDGRHPAHTGRGCGPGLRHVLFFHLMPRLNLVPQRFGTLFFLDGYHKQPFINGERINEGCGHISTFSPIVWAQHCAEFPCLIQWLNRLVMELSVYSSTAKYKFEVHANVFISAAF